MKSEIVFSGSGPTSILTTYEDFSNEKFSQKLGQKGIEKYVVGEVPLKMCIEKYGQHYDVIMKDVKQADDLRVLDYNGFDVFHKFPLCPWGKEHRHEKLAESLLTRIDPMADKGSGAWSLNGQH
jgi:hypothetical protein